MCGWCNISKFATYPVSSPNKERFEKSFKNVAIFLTEADFSHNKPCQKNLRFKMKGDD